MFDLSLLQQVILDYVFQINQKSIVGMLDGMVLNYVLEYGCGQFLLIRRIPAPLSLTQSGVYKPSCQELLLRDTEAHQS